MKLELVLIYCYWIEVLVIDIVRGKGYWGGVCLLLFKFVVEFFYDFVVIIVIFNVVLDI